MKYLINYAHNSHYQAQKLNSISGKRHGFDMIFPCDIMSIDQKFRNNNHHILSNEKGAGYWLWKPYIILKYLLNINDGDYLFYCDSGSVFLRSIDPLIELGEDITLFHTDPGPENYEAMQTKRDAFILMDCDNEKIAYSTPLHGGFQLYKKCLTSIEFLWKYLHYCQDERIISDNPNVMGYENYPEFIQHRHDQSILSLLAKKNGIPSFRDPTQYGNPYIQPGEYPQIIHHTRYNK